MSTPTPPSARKVAIVIFVLGDRYTGQFNQYFKQGVVDYCQRNNYDLIVRTTLIRNEPNMNKKKFFWQRFLVAKEYAEYDYVVSLDSDIYIHKNAPPLPFDEIRPGCIAAVNERKYLDNNYEWREMIQVRNGWEKTGKDWYAMAGYTSPSHDHLNGGLVIYQPQYHADVFVELYDKHIDTYMKYNQDDQSFLSIYLMENPHLIHWLDGRFNRVWYFWKEIFYPGFEELSNRTQKTFIDRFTSINYFCHFTSGTDIHLLV